MPIARPNAPAENASSLAVTLCAERVHLLAARALHWPRASTLFVADVHLGKAAAFRAGGVALPRGTTAGDLERLAALLDRTAATRLVVLGDFIHAADARVPALDAAFRAWRDAHAAVDVIVVRGNHDRHAGDPPPTWNVRAVDAPHALPPFLACHEPQVPPTGYALCGHVHPGVRLADGAGDHARLPCFVLGPRHALLPAFGRFTGLAPVPRRPHERVVAIAGTQLFALPPHG